MIQLPDAVRDLRARILAEGEVIGTDILKIDSFLNHQVDVRLLEDAGTELARRFAHAGATKVITVEASGIVPAAFTARALGVPLLFAKKALPSTIREGFFSSEVRSFTKNRTFDVAVSGRLISPADCLLIVDDFLAHGSTVQGLLHVAQQAGAQVAGVGIVVEKGFQSAGAALRAQGLEVVSLVVIEEMREGYIRFAEEAAPELRSARR